MSDNYRVSMQGHRQKNFQGGGDNGKNKTKNNTIKPLSTFTLYENPEVARPLSPAADAHVSM